VDTRYLKSFLRTVELRSISRAAESLGIAQPSLSQQLLRLEDEVGFKLFHRSARGVTVTEEGRVFQDHARHILRSIDQALEDVREAGEAAGGDVVLAMPHSVSRLIGIPLIEAVLNAAPEVSLRLIEAFSSGIRTSLEAGTIDIGLLNDRGSLRHFSARPLVSEELYLVGPAGRFGANAAEAPNVTPVDIGEFPLIIPGDQHELRAFLERDAARMGFTYRLAMEHDAVAHVPVLVARGHGLAILPLPAVESELAAGDVSVAHLGDGSLRRALCLARNRSKVVSHASVLVEDLVEWAIGQAISDGRWAAELERGVE